MSSMPQPRRFRYCAACGAERAVGAHYCGQCGAVHCPACGATVRTGARFCPHCGQPVNSLNTPPSPPPQPKNVPAGPLPVSQPLYPPGASPWLLEFVDRLEMMLTFEYLLAGTLGARHVVLLQGTKGIGKSFLLRRLQAECQQKQVPNAWLDLADPRRVDYIKIMRDVRDGLGEQEFQPFTDLLNFFTTQGYTLKLQVEVLNRDDRSTGGVTIQDQAQVGGIVAGRDAIVISDNNLSDPRRDIEIDPRRMQDALTSRFIEVLKSLCSKQRVVCLFDDVDHLEETTAYWFWRDFLGPLEAQTQFLAILTAATPPPVDRWVQAAIESTALSNLPEPHVVEYLQRRGVPEADRKGVLGFIMSDIGGYGHPEQMARLVDIYLKPRPGVTL